MLAIISFILLFELFLLLLVRYIRSKFQWLITSKDEHPSIDSKGLKKFLNHGFDPELGWVRKPNTSATENGIDGKTIYHISNNGARLNICHRHLPSILSTYGDSFCFCRQNNDNETWQHYLSEMTNTNVLNFGVGNYGLDQALLRLKREYPKNKTKKVIIAVVPSTIVRILCMWKHWNEYGNTFGFKPRYKLSKGNIVLLPNVIRTEEDFYNLKKYLPYLRENDYFYKTKFCKEIIQFPYIYTFFRNPRRNLKLVYYVLRNRKDEALMEIMKINLKLRVDLYKKANPVDIMEKIIDEFVSYSKEMGFEPIFMMIPQKDDILYIKETGDNYYSFLLERLKKKLKVIDVTKYWLDGVDLDYLYSDDNVYGGHPNHRGNKEIAKIVKSSCNLPEIVL